jgi:cobalamin synthase
LAKTTTGNPKPGTAKASEDADASDGRNETVAERSDRNWTDILQELRVTQTGTQIISAFLLTLAFQQRFTNLPHYEVVIYGVLVALAVLSTVMGLSVVSLHRSQFHRHYKPEIVARANRILSTSIWIVAALTAGVLLFIFDFVFGLTTGIVAAVLAFLAILWLLLILPRSVRAERQPATR